MSQNPGPPTYFFFTGGVSHLRICVTDRNLETSIFQEYTFSVLLLLSENFHRKFRYFINYS